MTKRFVIVQYTKAKENNINFAGQWVVYVSGREDEILASFGTHADATRSVKRCWASDILRNGYKTKAAASKNYSLNHLCDKYWNNDCWIKEIEIGDEDVLIPEETWIRK